MAIQTDDLPEDVMIESIPSDPMNPDKGDSTQTSEVSCGTETAMMDNTPEKKDVELEDAVEEKIMVSTGCGGEKNEAEESSLS
jgi:hypothetical protein